MTNWNTDDDPLASVQKHESLSFDQKPVGTTYQGVVIEAAKKITSTDKWPSGDFKQLVLIVLEVGGEPRSLWAQIPSAKFRALQDAQKTAGERIAPGGTLTIRLTGVGEKPSDPKKSAQKLYAAKYEPPDPFTQNAQTNGATAAEAQPPF